MKYDTNIDTIGIQIDASSIEEQNMIKFMLCRAIQEQNNVYIKYNGFLMEEEILFNNNKIASIKLGIIPMINNYTKQTYHKFYIALRFAGLKRYNNNLDNLSYNCLLTVCKVLNTFNEPYKFTELDICLDMNTNIENTLAICTKKLPRTNYNSLDTSFYKGNTFYIEKYYKNTFKNISQRAYLYNKSYKEGLDYPITRFELKLQKPFFYKNYIDYEKIKNTLDRYTIMYFKNFDEKNIIIEKYSSYSRISRRDLYRMGLENYRIKPDVSKIISFINTLQTCKYY